jgi:hypothetical protein
MGHRTRRSAQHRAQAQRRTGGAGGGGEAAGEDAVGVAAGVGELRVEELLEVAGLDAGDGLRD